MSDFNQYPTELTTDWDLSPRERNVVRRALIVAAISALAIVGSIVVQGASPEAMRIAQANQAANFVVVQ